jgi:hypothetical protein
MANNMTKEELVAMARQLTDDPANRNPRAGSFWLFTKETHRRLDNIAWAITYKIGESKMECAECHERFPISMLHSVDEQPDAPHVCSVCCDRLFGTTFFDVYETIADIATEETRKLKENP